MLSLFCLPFHAPVVVVLVEVELDNNPAPGDFDLTRLGNSLARRADIEEPNDELPRLVASPRLLDLAVFVEARGEIMGR
jgi:hypothetical protein